jgi:rare lipoprotein A
MRYGIKFGIGACALMVFSSCGSKGDSGGLETAPPAAQAPAPGVSDFPVRLGSAYQVGTTTYTPSDIAAYDEVGYASWYGADFEGRNTANGEIFMPAAITGAHKTLPMPSYVEVTSLETGRTILVRVNDRGPFANDRLIDLSEGAAKQLGITDQGVAGVRVRKVNPPEQDRAVLRNGQSAATRIDTPESLLKILREKLGKMPKPIATASAAPRPVAAAPGAAPQPSPEAAPRGNGRFVREGAGNAQPAQRTTPAPAAAPRSGDRYVREGASAQSAPQSAAPVAVAGYVVQISSFSSRQRADELARKLGAKVASSSDGRVFRVRFGPFATEAEAQRALADAQRRGYPQARLFRE